MEGKHKKKLVQNVRNTRVVNFKGLGHSNRNGTKIAVVGTQCFSVQFLILWF
jgi:hypothetical protein